MEDLDPNELESDRWLYVPGDSRDAWRDMASFAGQFPEARAREDLQVAVDGKGAFRRFQAALDRHEGNWVDWRVWSISGGCGALVSGRPTRATTRSPELQDPSAAPRR